MAAMPPLARRGRRGAHARRAPAISEILSVIMVTVALAIGTAVFVYTFQDRQDVSEEAVRGHTDLSRMRASELVTWSSAHCSDDGSLNFLLHNYGAGNLSTADMRAYGTWTDLTREFDGGAISYTTLSNATITGSDMRGGESAWARIAMGCAGVSTPTSQGFDWVCANPNFAPRTSFVCEETRVTLVTPAEDVVRVSVDGLRDPPQYPPRANIVSCLPAGPGDTTTRLCFDTSAQPLPLTGIEVWNINRNQYLNNGGTLLSNATAGDIAYSPDGNSACIEISRTIQEHTGRYILVNDEGKSQFGQRPYTVFPSNPGETQKVCNVRPLDAEEYVYCHDGRAIVRSEYVNGMCS